MRFSAIVLAAGTSSRMRGPNKLLLPLAGEPLIRRTVGRILQADPVEVVVVTGHEGRAVMRALLDLPVIFQPNLRFEEGQMTSVAAGAACLREPTDAVMVCLGDMALLEPEDYCELVSAFEAHLDRSILIPFHRGQRGNPVLFSAHHVPEVVSGQTNIGCRKLAADHPDEVFAYDATHNRYTVDLDTPEDYKRILARLDITERQAV